MSFEINIIKWLQGGRNDFFDVFFRTFAYIGTIWAVIIMALICFVVIDKKIGLAFLITEGCASLSSFVIKHIVRRARPFVSHPDILNLGHENGFSLPSGRATISIVITVFLFYIAFKYFKKNGRIIVGSIAVLFTLIMVVDRMYLGAHYITDIASGLAVGGIWCAISMVALAPFNKLYDKVVEKYMAWRKKRKEAKEITGEQQQEK